MFYCPKTQNLFFFSLKCKTLLFYINSVRNYGDWESVNKRPSLRTLKFHGRFGRHAASCPVKGEKWKLDVREPGGDASPGLV